MAAAGWNDANARSCELTDPLPATPTRLTRVPKSSLSVPSHCEDVMRATMSRITSRTRHDESPRLSPHHLGRRRRARGAPSLLLRSRATADIIVRNGTVFDGLGAPGKELDVVISGGRIIAVVRESTDKGTIEIDARGLAVAPGFIDIHSHGDGSLWSDPRAESLVRQGITTIVVGQDGSSRAPRATGDGREDDSRRQFATLRAALGGARPAAARGQRRVDGRTRHHSRRRRRRQRPSAQRPTSSRAWSSSCARRSPTARAARRRDSSTRRARSRRCDELIALCKPLAARRLPYATHMRNEDDKLIEAIDESIAVARGAGCPLQISHLKTQGPRNWNKLDTAFARVAAARAAGLRRRVRSLSVHRVSDRTDESLSRLESRRQHRRLPRAPQRLVDGRSASSRRRWRRSSSSAAGTTS